MTEKERPSREAAPARLHAFADALARHNEVEFERSGLRFTGLPRSSARDEEAIRAGRLAGLSM